jgi:hypothetical protein
MASLTAEVNAKISAAYDHKLEGEVSFRFSLFFQLLLIAESPFVCSIF